VIDGASRPAPAAPDRSRRASDIVAAARDLLEADGPEAVTMRRIGAALGIRAPSIYKHLPGKRAVEVALIVDALAEIGEILHRSTEAGGGDAIARLLSAYRAHALSHPNLYRLATGGPLPRDEIPAGLEEWAGRPFFTVTGDPFVAQALWSFAHGMVILELDDRYPSTSELDRTWKAGADAFAAASAGATGRRHPTGAGRLDDHDATKPEGTDPTQPRGVG
jgi:AcrR family transcriptional regulator